MTFVGKCGDKYDVQHISSMNINIEETPCRITIQRYRAHALSTLISIPTSELLHFFSHCVRLLRVLRFGVDMPQLCRAFTNFTL